MQSSPQEMCRILTTAIESAPPSALRDPNVILHFSDLIAQLTQTAGIEVSKVSPVSRDGFTNHCPRPVSSSLGTWIAIGRCLRLAQIELEFSYNVSFKVSLHWSLLKGGIPIAFWTSIKVVLVEGIDSSMLTMLLLGREMSLSIRQRWKRVSSTLLSFSIGRWLTDITIDLSRLICREVFNPDVESRIWVCHDLLYTYLRKREQ